MTARRQKEYLIPADDDGLPAPEVGPWAVEKYRRLGMYAEIFSTGMKHRWPSRVYVDLFSGSGHAILRDTRRRVLTSPLLALDVPDKFSKYIFCDRDELAIEALARRANRLAPAADVSCVTGDANERVADVLAQVPSASAPSRCLGFCFVDPYGLDVHFATIERLAEGREMDFLILLALGMDANRNWDNYVRPESSKVDLFLGDAGWRGSWREARTAGTGRVRFLATEYAKAMCRIGYRPTPLDRMIEVKTTDNNMRLYYLAFFSKHEKGYQFWDEVRKYSTEQLGLI